MKIRNLINPSMPRRALLALAVTTALGAGTTLAWADAITLKVAFSADYFMSSPDLAKKWFGEVKDGFEKANPDVKVELVPIQGGYDDFLTKLSLMYRTQMNSDIAEVPAPELGQWVALTCWFARRSARQDHWWSQYVEPVAEGQSMARSCGESRRHH